MRDQNSLIGFFDVLCTIRWVILDLWSPVGQIASKGTHPKTRSSETWIPICKLYSTWKAATSCKGQSVIRHWLVLILIGQEILLLTIFAGRAFKKPLFASRRKFGLLATPFGQAWRAVALTCDDLLSLKSRPNLLVIRPKFFAVCQLSQRKLSDLYLLS